MVSEPEGRIVVPVWVDDDVVKALIDDTGAMPVNVQNWLATQDVRITGCTITLPVSTVASGSSVQSQIYGWDLSNWRKQAMLWGFTARHAENFDTTASGGNVNIYSTVVPSGYVYVIQNVSVRNATSGPTNYTMFQRASGAQASFFHDQQALAQWRAAIYNGTLVLGVGDDIGINVVGASAGDSIQARLWGYKMKINE